MADKTAVLKALDTGVELFNGVMTFFHVFGMAKEAGEKDASGKQKYTLDHEKIRQFKIPAKLFGLITDEVLWGKIESLLTPKEVEMMSGWLGYLRRLKRNDEVIYFLAKSLGPLRGPAAVVNNLRNVYFASARRYKTKHPHGNVYAYLTKMAQDRNVMGEKSTDEVLGEKWGEFTAWMKKKPVKRAKKAYHKSIKAIDADTERIKRLRRKKQRERDKKKGWF